MTFEDSVEKSLSDCLVAARGREQVTDLNPSEDEPEAIFDGVSLILGLSGGTDSTALLLALVALREKMLRRKQEGLAVSGLALELSACHVNHHLRGAESAADEQFCRELCQQLAVPIYTVDLEDVGESEAQLRSARYEALIKLAKQVGAPYIVTAHNLDDQVETLLFRLVRGTALRGLAGMAAARPMEASLWPILLRPLLSTSRREIEAYLEEKGINARFDSSNSDSKYSRNFLRAQIMGPLKERFPGVLTNIEHFRRTIESENDYMADCALQLYQRALGRGNRLLISVLEGEHEALIGRVIATYMEAAGIMPSFQRVRRCLELMRQASGSRDRYFSARLSLGENQELLVDKDSILLKPQYELEASDDEYLGRFQAMSPVPVKLPRPGRSSALTLVPWLNFAFSLEEAASLDPERLAGLERSRSSFAVPVRLSDIDCEQLVFRPRRPGDRLHPAGMAASVRLKQYLHANKTLFAGARSLLPALNEILALRLFPVLADSQEVLWVPGFGLSEKIRSGGKSRSGAPTHLISLVPISHDEPGPRPEIFGGGIDAGTC